VTLAALNRQLQLWERPNYYVLPYHALGYCTSQQFVTEWHSQRKVSKYHKSSGRVKRTGSPRCHVARLEDGHTVPALERLERFARALMFRKRSSRPFVSRQNFNRAVNSSREQHVRLWFKFRPI
jgi:hypothetical protein